MIVVVSPYHLTTREPAAMAALQLGERIVTMLPAPLTGGGPSAALEAASRSPRYRAFVESWRWLMPLWEAGVIIAKHAGEDVAADVRRVSERVERDEALSELRPFMKPGLFEDEARYLDAVAEDVLKGGPDPGICVPVAAGLDRFASRHGLVVARSQPLSIAQQAEARMGARLFAVGVPIVLQASGQKILEVRERLAEELEALRKRMGEAIAAGGGGGDRMMTMVIGELEEAARAYAAAFTRCWGELSEQDEAEVRVVEGTVTLIGMRLPVDSVLRSSTTAARAMAGVNGSRALPGAGSSTLPALWEPGEGGLVTAVIVKKVGGAAPRRR